MKRLLRFAGVFNISAGICMILFYHEGYRMLGVEKPELTLEIQVIGILVALFGVGYLRTASRPVENRDLLLLGMLSKGISSVFALGYIASGALPWWFAVVVFFADIVYVPPFWIIWRRLCRAARETKKLENAAIRP